MMPSLLMGIPAHAWPSFPGRFMGGTILLVGVTVEKAQYLDLDARRVARLLLRRALIQF